MKQPPVYDIPGRQIKPGDLLRSFHFRAAVRRQRHYLYHVAREHYSGHLQAVPVAVIADPQKRQGTFWISEGSVVGHSIEIVHCDCTDPWQDRPKKSKAALDQ